MPNPDLEKIQDSLEGFGKTLYTHAAKSRQARAASAAVDYLDNMGVLAPLHISPSKADNSKKK